jgi:hypothetical protein
MLRISRLKSTDLSIFVVDPYVPIAARTYTVPIGAVFYRVGNFQTSLVEVPIDPMTGLIRGLKVVFIDRVGAVIDASKHTAIQGLPAVARDAIPNRLHDDPREVAVALDHDQFIVD